MTSQGLVILFRGRLTPDSQNACSIFRVFFLGEKWNPSCMLEICHTRPRKMICGPCSFRRDRSFGTLIKDRDSGQSKGFAFVEMANQAEAQKAITMFNGYNMGDRELRVSLANPA